MNFISLEYFILLVLAVTASRILKPKLAVWAVLLASLVFYGWGYPAYLILLLGVGTLAWTGGVAVERWRSPIVLWALIITALVPLFYFKYLGFSITTFNDIATLFGAPAQTGSYMAAITLPLGISFFTFQAISYVMDVYRREISAERSPVTFMLFKAFFPQLVAGPIERAPHLIPQLKALGTAQQPRLDLATPGFQILKGLLIKFVIADNMAGPVAILFASAATRTPADMLLASYFFSIQIYCDFYGYTMIALGSAKLFGVDLINNFNHPYYAPNIQQFWRRWHISLMLWFRDYVYVPLGGNRRGRIILIRNVLIVMTLTALWHGANYTFLIWGLGHGALLMLHRLFGWARQQIKLPSLGIIGSILGTLLTFHAVTALWIFFRAPDLATAFVVLSKIATLPLSDWHVTLPYYSFYLGVAALFVVFSLADYLSTIESRLAASALPIQAAAIASVLLLTYAGPFADVQFIYFQF